MMSATRAGGRVLARPSTSLAPRILILGGGFAGVTAALELAKRCAGLLPVHITLVSNQNFFLFTPMLVEAATGAVETRHILYPIRPLCGRWGIEFGEMQVEGIDLERRRVTVRHHRSPLRQQVQYDKLVLALGATPNVGQVPGAAEHALTFKDVGDAFRIRNRVIELFDAGVVRASRMGLDSAHAAHPRGRGHLARPPHRAAIHSRVAARRIRGARAVAKRPDHENHNSDG
jgi:NADH dehydrogenase